MMMVVILKKGLAEHFELGFVVDSNQLLNPFPV